MGGRDGGTGPVGPPGPPARDELTRLGASPGLCAACRHASVLASRASAFLRCGRAAIDPSFPKYPRLPVLACHGYDPIPGGPGDSGGATPA